MTWNHPLAKRPLWHFFNFQICNDPIFKFYTGETMRHTRRQRLLHPANASKRGHIDLAPESGKLPTYAISLQHQFITFSHLCFMIAQAKNISIGSIIIILV